MAIAAVKKSLCRAVVIKAIKQPTIRIDEARSFITPSTFAILILVIFFGSDLFLVFSASFWGLHRGKKSLETKAKIMICVPPPEPPSRKAGGISTNFSNSLFATDLLPLTGQWPMSK